MQAIKVLNLQHLVLTAARQSRPSDPRIQLTNAAGWFDGEVRETWPEFSSRRYMAADAQGHGSREERDALLSEAEIILGGWPFPLDLRKRAPKLKWFHQLPAGASNLRLGDLWGSDVMVTTSRGVGSTLAIAEYALAGILHFAKSLAPRVRRPQAGAFDHRAYWPLLLDGKTACVVGAGGIGQDVGKLCAALGMRVLGTRRHVEPGAPLPAGFSRDGDDGRSRRLPAAERLRHHLRAMDAGDDAADQQGPLCGDEAGLHPRQHRARRDRRRGRAGRCAGSATICAAPRSTSMWASSSACRRRGCGPTRAC